MYSIDYMNMSKVNLNLLVALDALLTERNVTRAGKKIFITQSAMSNALNQLREIFGDDLLIRSTGGMQPTQRALELQPKVKELLDSINHVIFDQPQFDAATSTRRFTLGMSDHAEFCLNPQLLKILNQEAPGIEILIKHMNFLSDEELIARGDIELAIGCGLTCGTQMLYEQLFKIDAVVIARKDHPLMRKKMALNDYLNAKHIRIAFRDSPEQTKIDEALTRLNVHRNVAISMPHVLPALFILGDSDLITTTPNFLHDDMLKQLNLTMQPTPFTVPSSIIHQAWHRQYDNDPGHQWLRAAIKRAANNYNQATH